MSLRFQQTLARPATVKGIGFVTGADLAVRFLPAPAGHGIAFLRRDLAELTPIPALVQYTAPRTRRTALQYRGMTVELIEHAMAALAGLRIDNCLVELNGPEVPGCDGSSRPFVDALLSAGIIPLTEPRLVRTIDRPLSLETNDPDVVLAARPAPSAGLQISYELDYGLESPIPAQSLTLSIDPATFVREIAFARTFILESEVQAFRAQGMGQRLSFQDLLIYGHQGVVGNQLRAADECVRHKILDCIGDLALLGCDLSGHVRFRRTGHRHNADFVKAVQQEFRSEAGCFRDAA